RWASPPVNVTGRCPVWTVRAWFASLATASQPAAPQGILRGEIRMTRRRTLRARSLALVSLAVLAGLALVVGPAAQAVSRTVVVDEFRVRGPNGGNDEFVELYNVSATPVAIGGWKVKGSNNAGTVSTRATIAAGTTLQPGCHYLLTNSSTSGGPYSGSVPGDQTYGTGITD